MSFGRQRVRSGGRRDVAVYLVARNLISPRLKRLKRRTVIILQLDAESLLGCRGHRKEGRAQVIAHVRIWTLVPLHLHLVSSSIQLTLKIRKTKLVVRSKVYLS